MLLGIEMSDYRVEKARIRLSESINDVDPNENIDSAELCWVDASGMDANSCGAQPLSDFYAAAYPDWQEDDKWFPPNDGIESVTKLLSHYQQIIDDQNDPLGREISVIQDKIDILENVLQVLTTAKESNAYFCFAVSE